MPWWWRRRRPISATNQATRKKNIKENEETQMSPFSREGLTSVWKQRVGTQRVRPSLGTQYANSSFSV
jgi:hypothetical protein